MSVTSIRPTDPGMMDGGCSALLRGDPITGDRYWSRQAQNRLLGPKRGHGYINKLADDELTDYFHHTLFPNVTITAAPNDGCVHIFRTEPDLDHPEKCTFEYMPLVPRIDGVSAVETVAGMRPIEEARLEQMTYGNDSAGDFVDEDLSVAVRQQQGLHSRGYRDAHLSEQEARVRRWTSRSITCGGDIASDVGYVLSLIRSQLICKRKCARGGTHDALVTASRK